MKKKWLMLAGVGLLVGILALSMAVPALAQTTTPTVPTTPQAHTLGGWGKDLGFGFGGSWATYDAVAGALGLTPVELFTELHSGKTLSEIATAKGVDLQKVQDAANAARVAEEKAAIEQAVKDGTLTQAQADWMLQGIAQGWMPMGRGGHGHGMGGRGLLEGNTQSGTPQSNTPPSGNTPSVTPSTSSF
jgi:hypothetical protein